ncbi:MAG: hypothetical protein AB1487_04375, partial [Thermodesulfobacteriota bacterium]
PTSLFQREEKHFPLWKRGIEGDFGPYSALLSYIFQKPKVLRISKFETNPNFQIPNFQNEISSNLS